MRAGHRRDSGLSSELDVPESGGGGSVGEGSGVEGGRAPIVEYVPVAGPDEAPATAHLFGGCFSGNVAAALNGVSQWDGAMIRRGALA